MDTRWGWTTVDNRGHHTDVQPWEWITVDMDNRRVVEPWRMRFPAWITVCINLQPASTVCQAAERPIAMGAAARPRLAPAGCSYPTLTPKP